MYFKCEASYVGKKKYEELFVDWLYFHVEASFEIAHFAVENYDY